MRVVFLGTPDFAVPSLKKLLRSDYEIAAVFTQPDRPSGRGRKVSTPPVKSLALEAGIPVFQPEKIRRPENQPLLESFDPDFIVVVAYGQILPGWLLQLPRIAPVNVHGSLLPKYRGAAPVAWAILKGERVSGVTTMLMDEHLDTGPMLLRRETAIPETMTAGELAAVLAGAGAGLLIETLDGLAAGTIEPVPQDDAGATLAPRITKEMGKIDWERPAREIHNLVRALNPRPLAYTGFRNRRLQILRTLPEAAPTPGIGAPGAILGPAGDALRVRCGEASVLDILEVQPEGKKRITGRAFANGARIGRGDVLKI